MTVDSIHAVEIADINGDGLMDIVTGKTYRAHDFGDPGARQAPVIYYFRLTRQDGQAEFVPHLVDDQAGWLGVSGKCWGSRHTPRCGANGGPSFCPPYT